jgi:hypothetical protein
VKDYQICIDGKRAKGVNPRNELHQRLHILSAWVSDFNICIGQQSTDQKSNEITALPLLIDQLEISNATVSIDAMGCQSDKEMHNRTLIY